MSQPKRILIVINHTKANAAAIGAELGTVATACGWEVSSSGAFPLPDTALEGMDLCVVVGGDGSLLGVVRAVAHHPVPVMGVNLGTLGYMANFSAEAAVEELRTVLHQSQSPSSRRLLEIQPNQGPRTWALNDVVIKAVTSRLARVSVSANGQFVNTYYADGLIISAPTGSTAYNLAAGGPILHPDVHAMVVTPINPHTLTNRAIVLNDDVDIAITLNAEDTPVQISTDGIPIATNEGHKAFPLQVRICPDRCFPLIQPPAISQFDLLRTRLRWMGETPSRLQHEDS